MNFFERIGQEVCEFVESEWIMIGLVLLCGLGFFCSLVSIAVVFS